MNTRRGAFGKLDQWIRQEDQIRTAISAINSGYYEHDIHDQLRPAMEILGCILVRTTARRHKQEMKQRLNSCRIKERAKSKKQNS
jgi:hypothetical protein